MIAGKFPRVTLGGLRGTVSVMKTRFVSCLFGLGLGLSLALGQAEKKEEKKAEPAKETDQQKKPAPTNEVAVIKTTQGEMVIEFWPDVAPKTVENFKKLATNGFYDGTAFHRIIKGFMIQGGDPLTKDEKNEARFGTGDPGYKIDAEFNSRKHVRGVISMARSGDPRERTGAMPGPQFANSAGSQFFICLAPASNLDGRYTAFGKLIKGDDVLGKIGDTPVGPSLSGEPSKPQERVEVRSVKIVSKDSVK
jgi:peptidyl-prolyl cis-trans isomerase B (cyclophilin B)